MSWSINFVGPKASVKRRMQTISSTIDPSQLSVVRTFVISTIDALPESVTGVQITARGERSETTYRLEMEIQPVDLVLDAP